MMMHLASLSKSDSKYLGYNRSLNWILSFLNLRGIGLEAL